MKKTPKTGITQMADIAEIVGVSTSTVSRALSDSPLVSEKTRKLIKQVAEEHSYRVNAAARNFRVKDSLRVAVLMPKSAYQNWSISDPFFLELIAAIAEALDDHGHQLLLTRTKPQSGEWIAEFIHNRQADGVILIGQGSEHKMINELAQRYRAISVWGAKVDEDQAYPVVGSDNHLGGQRAASHLIERGRQKIAFIGYQEAPEIFQRFLGYQDALNEHGPGFDPNLVPALQGCSGDPVEELNWLTEHKVSFDALFAASDRIAIGAMHHLQSQGISIPEQVAVVGYDDIPMASYSHPPLTTIYQNRSIGAKILVDNLLEALDGHKPEALRLDPELIVRQSS